MSGWGPEGRQASVSLTFDHLGEAAELEAGAWPEGAAIGNHHSVTEIVPRLLGALRRQGIAATFFVEAWNAEHYPEVLRELLAAGHEIGCHSFRHENWEQLDLAQIEDLLRRSMEAYVAAGVEVRGVRPPGGIPPAGYSRVLRAGGIEYVSIANDNYGVDAGLAHVPFQWRTIDGAYYTGHFAKLRQPPGDQPTSIDEMLAAWAQALDDVVAVGGHNSFLFHVPWQDCDERIDAVEEFARALAADERLWVATAGEVAGWMREQPERYPYLDPGIPRRAWTPEEIEQAASLSATLLSSGRDPEPGQRRA